MFFVLCWQYFLINWSVGGKRIDDDGTFDIFCYALNICENVRCSGSILN